ncbi:MAG TPA: polysaccharide biosynthesis/export family protein [Caulobacteraceae bacterium]|nr:polysaccharide biosynthesis/export family protein [Caulobacteraceae bacterium]
MQRRSLITLVLATAALGPLAPAHAHGKLRSDPDFPNIPYASWTDDEPLYRLYPGDEVDFQVGSAPELNKIVTVLPDGRISLPLIGPVMAANRTIEDLQAALKEAYSHQLVRPDVMVSLRTAQPLKVFVGGEVDHAGVIDMTGDLDALRAIFMAGGFRNSAKRNEVVIIRRGPNGRAMMRTVDMARALRDPAHADLVPLRRFDIVYVPKSGVAEAGVFVQQYFRDLTPVNFGFSYALGAGAIP